MILNTRPGGVAYEECAARARTAGWELYEVPQLEQEALARIGAHSVKARVRPCEGSVKAL